MYFKMSYSSQKFKILFNNSMSKSSLSRTVQENYQNSVACIWSQGTLIFLAKKKSSMINILVALTEVCSEPAHSTLQEQIVKVSGICDWKLISLIISHVP